jgi:hypothetical protein
MLRYVVTLGALLVTSMGSPARDVETEMFQIAGVGPMELPMTAEGAVPTEDRKVRIDFAGFMVVKPRENPGQAALAWSFGFRAKSLKNLESVRIEEVSPTATAIVRVMDAAPRLSGRDWVGWSEQEVASAGNHPWLYADGSSVFVFRFTIKERGKEPRVYYQPTSFSTAVKKQFQAMIDKINQG